MPPTDPILEQQIAYYRARASEYDEWFLRQGRYDRGAEWNSQWLREVQEVRGHLDRFRPVGRVLELACGTGWWTEQLLRCAEHVTAVDASAEVLALNRARVGAERVRFVQADLFRWRPDERYDAVFFSFWLSHVPPDRFESFWQLVRSALVPAGRVFFIDSLRTETSTATDHRLPDTHDVIALRRLNDEREFRIYKIFYHPDALADRLRALGWHATVTTTANYFLVGSGQLPHAGRP
ncbi:MAG TPA: class I SAM-dependent methyltransferase [Gemmatimonadaceae bacterium]